MTLHQFLALLRGINVGGNNIIKMTDLKSCLEHMGFDDVLTYIQSGNVLFKSEEKDQAKLINSMERELSERFSYKSRVVVISHAQLKTVIDKAPKGFGREPEKYRYDFIFLKKPLNPDTMMKSIDPKEGVDTAYAGESVLYFSRLISKASQSRLTRIISLPAYKDVTVRNWNTTTKLLALMEK